LAVVELQTFRGEASPLATIVPEQKEKNVGIYIFQDTDEPVASKIPLTSREFPATVPDVQTLSLIVIDPAVLEHVLSP
jgi:hypothetical protein